MVFLDTNILLEIILKNRSKCSQVENFLQTLTEYTAISMLSVHLIMYFGRKEQVSDDFLESIIKENTIFPISPEDYNWALSNEKGKDFEDALQIAVAIRSGSRTFVTLDRALVKSYSAMPIRIITI